MTRIQRERFPSIEEYEKVNYGPLWSPPLYEFVQRTHVGNWGLFWKKSTYRELTTLFDKTVLDTAIWVYKPESCYYNLITFLVHVYRVWGNVKWPVTKLNCLFYFYNFPRVFGQEYDDYVYSLALLIYRSKSYKYLANCMGFIAWYLESYISFKGRILILVCTMWLRVVLGASFLWCRSVAAMC